jgi:DNA invertase Pin-like site-specific DNA recombinase
MVKSPRCAIYARVSTDDQDESLQLTALQEFVSQRGWELKTTYVDHGVSSRSIRPELERMMKDAHKRRLDVVRSGNLTDSPDQDANWYLP